MWRCVETAADARVVLREWMDAYGNDIWNYAFVMLQNAADADDITQEVFLRLYRDMPEFLREPSLKLRIFALTRSCIADYKRSSIFRRLFFYRQTETGMAQHSPANKLWRQILSLPAKSREVLILFGHYRFSLHETAAILHISAGKVKARLRDARRRILEQGEDGQNGSEQRG